MIIRDEGLGLGIKTRLYLRSATWTHEDKCEEGCMYSGGKSLNTSWALSIAIALEL